MDQPGAGTAPEGLIELLKEQRDLYRRLQELSLRQRRLIAGDRPELLLNVLRDRQTLVLAAAKINEQLSPYRRDWERICAALPEEVHRSAAGLLVEIDGLLQVILQADQEDQALLSARKQAAARSLSDVSGGRAANAAYAPQASRTDEGGAADMTG